MKLSSLILFFRADLQTFVKKFALSECIRRTLRQGGNADRSMTLFSFACFFSKSNHQTVLTFFSRYPYKLHTYSSSLNREPDKSYSAPSLEKQSSSLVHFSNIFQHFSFPILKTEEKKSLSVNVSSPNKVL